MSLHTEAVMRGMPEGVLSDDEITQWWYRRDLDHLAVVVRLRNENQRLREALGRFVDGQFASLAEQGLVRDEARKLLGQGRGEE